MCGPTPIFEMFVEAEYTTFIIVGRNGDSKMAGKGERKSLKGNGGGGQILIWIWRGLYFNRKLHDCDLSSVFPSLVLSAPARRMQLDCHHRLSPHRPISEFSGGRCSEVRGSGGSCELDARAEAACITRIATRWSLQQHQGMHFQKVTELTRFLSCLNFCLVSKVQLCGSEI